MKYFVIRTFRGTCSSVGMLKGYMVRERLETPVIALEERCFVDMTSEHLSQCQTVALRHNITDLS